MNAPRPLLELPRFVQIEPVGQCNLRCRMCPIQFREDGTPNHPPAFMSYTTFCRLIDQFTQVTQLHLQGMGEPLMHPRFFDMVGYAARRGIEVTTNSNLTLLSERRAEECVRSRLHRIHVSLDGAEASTYEYIRVQGHFHRVIRNIRRLLAARKQLESELPELHLVAVAMRRNLQELPRLVRLAHELGVEDLSVQHLCHDFGESSLPAKYLPMRRFVDDETLLHEDPQRVERYFGEARETARELGVRLRLPNIRRRPYSPEVQGRSRCDWPWRGAYLSYNGQAMPCCIVATPDRVNFGNMERDGAAAVWNNEAYDEFRSRLECGTPPEVCRTCAVYTGTF